MIGQNVGQRNLAITGNTYSHVLADERELDYPDLLPEPGRAHLVQTPTAQTA